MTPYRAIIAVIQLSTVDPQQRETSCVVIKEPTLRVLALCEPAPGVYNNRSQCTLCSKSRIPSR